MIVLITLQYLIFIINILSSSEGLYDNYNIQEDCKREMEKSFLNETYLDDSYNFLLEIMRGKIPFKIDDSPLYNFDLNFMKRINKNIPCLYYYKNTNYKNNITNGLFLGAGINLFNYNNMEMKIIIGNSLINNKSLYYDLIEDLRIFGYKTILIPKYKAMFKEIDKFNSAIMDFTINKYLKEANETKQYKTTLINGILSLYFQLFQGDSDLKSYLGYSSSQLSYIVEHLFETSPYARLIQSKLILMMDGTIKYNSNHIFLVVPIFLFDEEDIDLIKELISVLYNTLNYNNILNANRISILALKNNSDFSNYIINYNNKKDNLDILFKTNYKNKNASEFLDLENIYEDLNIKYNDNINKKIYENKIAILLINHNTSISDSPDLIIENYKKKYSIQTIPIINVKGLKQNIYDGFKDIIKYNILYNFSESIYLAPLKLAISNMHINIDLTNKNKTTLNNLNLNDIDTPMYIEVDINKENKETQYYEISLNIIKTSGYNIFISDSNPYPSIKSNYTNFLKYENNYNPILRIKSYNINKFFIGIEGVLFFNISIEKKYANETEIKNLILSEGDYKNINFTSSIQLKDKHLTMQSFLNNENDNYKIYSNIFKNESMDNMMKYFTRGIDLDNTNDKTFFNYELFLYLFGETHLINRVYKDQNNNYYFGRYLQISEYSPLNLKAEGFNRLTINKLYPFLKITNTLSTSAPPLIFNKDELEIIYGITYSYYINDLSNILKRFPNVIQFENQTPTMKFILFSLYFTYYYDSKIIKNIVNLSLNKPKYTEVLQYLKDKKQDSDSFLINYINQMEQEDKLEKIMVSIIMGKSLILSDIGINFIKGFNNYMRKTKTKISISIYDTLKSENKIKNIFYFSSTSSNKIDDISNYYNTSSDERNKYNNSEQYMDFDKIINFGLSQFSKYDNGIKKRIIIICDENIYNEKYFINNKLINLNNKKHIELIDNQIDILIVTTKNYEKGEIHDLFNEGKLKEKNTEEENIKEIPYSLYENYFHIKDLNKIDEYMNDLSRVIKDSFIRINAGKRIINDYYQGKMTYYEINFKEYPTDVVVIKANITNFNFYSSLTHPFPNSYKGDLLTTDDPNYISFSYPESKGIVYLGLEPINSVIKQEIEIFTCESFAPNTKCKFVGDYKNDWLLFFFLFFGFALLFVIYKCRVNLSSDLNSKNIKRLNVFDNVK